MNNNYNLSESELFNLRTEAYANACTIAYDSKSLEYFFNMFYQNLIIKKTFNKFYEQLGNKELL